MTGPAGDVDGRLTQRDDASPRLPVMTEPLPSHLTTIRTWSAEIGYAHTAVLRWQRQPGFPAPLAQLRRASGGRMAPVYNRADLAAYLAAGHTVHGLPLIDEPLPDRLITLALWADDIGYSPATVQNWASERRFPPAAAMLHGSQAVYRRADLAAYLADPRVSGYPPDQPLPAGLTTLEDWATAIGYAQGTVQSWTVERNFPAPVAKRGRQRVYNRADLDAYHQQSDPRLMTLNAWAAAIGRSLGTVQEWSRLPGFPEPVATRGGRQVYRRSELGSQLPWTGRPRRTSSRTNALEARARGVASG